MAAVPARGSLSTATNYFAYGANMAPSVMAAWCPNHVCLGAARLGGYELAFLRRSVRWDAGAADIVPSPGASVWGVLYELSGDDLAALDAKESSGKGYRRIDVRIELLDGSERTAACYEVIEKAERELRPRPEYLALLVKGARARGLPAPWIAFLEGLGERFGLPGRA
ncbi:MAG TPA: gamma-glutamylcyclotransferase family protein [Solirubrobacteraceae bacterium]|nr:gamma-glutamylcyclotransferase family protein [Solirubrobacteraceae bacterium]